MQNILFSVTIQQKGQFTSEVGMGNTDFVCDVSIFFPYSIFITITVFRVGCL